jgi:hypothetical protein
VLSIKGILKWRSNSTSGWFETKIIPPYFHKEPQSSTYQNQNSSNFRSMSKVKLKITFQSQVKEAIKRSEFSVLQFTYVRTILIERILASRVYEVCTGNRKGKTPIPCTAILFHPSQIHLSPPKLHASLFQRLKPETLSKNRIIIPACLIPSSLLSEKMRSLQPYNPPPKLESPVMQSPVQVCGCALIGRECLRLRR